MQHNWGSDIENQDLRQQLMVTEHNFAANKETEMDKVRSAPRIVIQHADACQWQDPAAEAVREFICLWPLQ